KNLRVWQDDEIELLTVEGGPEAQLGAILAKNIDMNSRHFEDKGEQFLIQQLQQLIDRIIHKSSDK
ncbi:7305_t:CDS:2, partial [Entrophospora sp. SA101]